MSFKTVQSLEIPRDQCRSLFSQIDAENINPAEDLPAKGGIFSNLKHAWLAKGSYLEVRHLASGRKIGSWRFGGFSRDQNTVITAVEELKRDQGTLSFLIVALYCRVTGGLICVFDCFLSKVLRAIHIDHHVIKLHVVDPGCSACTLPASSPLKYLDGTLAIGTLGGDVLLMDLYKQVCESVFEDLDKSIRDEVNPCTMTVLKKEKLNNVKKYIERSVDREEHIVIYLNVADNSSSEYFTLKKENDEDIVHVNRSELEVSAIFYSQQLGCLLVGYNFGAFQMWDLRTLKLSYTSPICDDNIPITGFMVQEPEDDPKAYCYVWVSYSHNLLFQRGLPFAVMYSFYFNNKTVVDGYGNLYENFQHCSIRFQLELGDPQPTSQSVAKGGTFLGFQSVNKWALGKDSSCLSLCLISWVYWNSNKEVNSAILLFDLNQWYKEQMPRVPNWVHCSNYIIKNSVEGMLLDIKIDPKSLVQFMGIQRLEEHFCPTSLSFDLWGVLEHTIIKLHNKGIQKEFLDKVMSSRHLALLRPDNIYEQVSNLGLIPLFCDIRNSASLDLESEREILLSVVLEQNMVSWISQAASKVVDNSCQSADLTICNVLVWAFKRAVTIKNALHKYCSPLFDYSGMTLDDNTLTLISCGVHQIRSICTLYRFIWSKHSNFVLDQDSFMAELKSFENLVVYFEVLLWMTSADLLPERQIFSPADKLLSAPYLVQELTQYYHTKRANLQLSTGGTFVEKDSLLFIDNLINRMEGADLLRKQWQDDGGNGLYPPPSLQSVLRTYLVNGPELKLKHSLVAYVLLDIASLADERNMVFKLLLKFPQIFDLSQSDIKIVQAFWYLDHERFENALESILDPSVLLEDLQPWHHTVMMTSLLMQEQTNLALLYLQIRKPSIQDEKDFFTVVSLLISRNMLDEAFKFRQQHKGHKDYELLTHIFNECNKNQTLHSLLYRKLSSDEENSFFKYLQGMRNPQYEDLQMFYYLVRARFLEAFDVHSLTRRTPIDSKGLHAQQNASTADSVIKMFKQLLPPVNKTLVELVQKERANLWKEHPRPVPFSVFVHNSCNQVQYKSSVIFAALSKAKETFNNTTKTPIKVGTENTPFLKTPTAFKSRATVDTPVLRTKVVEQNVDDEFSPTPCKRMKLSPRCSVKSNLSGSRNLLLNDTQSKLNTPIIKRKSASLNQSNVSSAVRPPSILKSRNVIDTLMSANTSVNTSLQEEYENSFRKSRIDLKPRESLRTPLRSRVKFDDIRYSGSSLESSKNDSAATSDVTNVQSTSTSMEISETAGDIFYSPQHSFEDNKSEKNQESKTSSIETDIAPIQRDDVKVFEDSPLVDEMLKRDEEVVSKNVPKFESPRSRRSYKRSFVEAMSPVRSSPRRSRKLSETNETNTSTTTSPGHSPSVSRSSTHQIGGRKSLSRSTLEQNTLSHFRNAGSSASKSTVVDENRFSISFLEITESGTSYYDSTPNNSTLSLRKEDLFDDTQDKDDVEMDVETEAAVARDESEDKRPIIGETASPVRSSPRLSRRKSTDASSSQKSSTSNSPVHTRSIKIKGRRSLSRSVLEQNAFSVLRNTSTSIKQTIEKDNEEKRPSLCLSDISDATFSDLDTTGTTSDSSWFRKKVIFRDSVDEDESEPKDAETPESKRELELQNTDDFTRKIDNYTTSTETFATQKNDESALTQSDKDREVAMEKSDERSLSEPSSPSPHQEDLSHVYDDLSSASEDIKQVVERLKDEKTDINSPNVQCEDASREYARFFDDMDLENSCEIKADKKTGAERANLNEAVLKDVIEINSSDDDVFSGSTEPYASEKLSSRSSLSNTSSSPSSNSESSFEIRRGAVITTKSSVEGPKSVSSSDTSNVESDPEKQPDDQAAAETNVPQIIISADNEDTNVQKNISHDVAKLEVNITEKPAEKVPESDTPTETRSISVQFPPIDQSISSTVARSGGIVKTLPDSDLASVSHDVAELEFNVLESDTPTETRSVSVQFPPIDQTTGNVEGSTEGVTKTVLESDPVSTEKLIANVEQSPADPLLLRTVKKTYSRYDPHLIDRTPKLAVQLTKRTYSRSRLNTNSVDASNTQNNENQAESIQNIANDEVSKTPENKKKRKDADVVIEKNISKVPTVEKFKTSERIADETLDALPDTNESPAVLKLRTVKKSYGKIPANFTDVNKFEENLSSRLTQTVKASRLFENFISESSAGDNTEVGSTESNETPEAVNRNNEKCLESSTSVISTGDKEILKKPSSMRKRRTLSCQDRILTSSSEEFLISETVEIPKSKIGEAVEQPSRITRRRSKSISNMGSGPKLDVGTDEQTQGTEKRRTRRLLGDDTSLSALVFEEAQTDDRRDVVAPKSTSKTRTKKTVNINVELPAVELLTLKTRKRSRSYSTDQIPTTAKGRSSRSASIDLVLEEPDSFDLTIEDDATLKEGPRRVSKPSSQIGDYSTSRRLTRRQASMLESINSERKLPAVAEIDPIDLLDKPEFKGKLDIEEAKILERSPSTGSEASSRQTRSVSVTSEVGTPTKKRGKTPKSATVETPSTSGIKTRLRKASTDTMSVASEKSDDVPTTPKKSKTPARSRSRANSVSSTKSNSSQKTTTSTRSTRARKQQLSEIDLPAVEEEMGDAKAETETPATPSRKRGRK